MPEGGATPTNQVHELFDALASGELDRFLVGTCDDLVLTVSGSGRRTTLVARDEIPAWYGSMQELAGRSFSSDVRLVLAEERTFVVMLRHTLSRDGVEYQYETVNHCTFRDGGLASWFSHPVRASDYARAWGIHHQLDRKSA
jgi:ketosteroid isomerase-like protein